MWLSYIWGIVAFDSYWIFQAIFHSICMQKGSRAALLSWSPATSTRPFSNSTLVVSQQHAVFSEWWFPHMKHMPVRLNKLTARCHSLLFSACNWGYWDLINLIIPQMLEKPESDGHSEHLQRCSCCQVWIIRATTSTLLSKCMLTLSTFLASPSPFAVTTMLGEKQAFALAAKWVISPIIFGVRLIQLLFSYHNSHNLPGLTATHDPLGSSTGLPCHQKFFCWELH